jgi:hypothetical protein
MDGHPGAATTHPVLACADAVEAALKEVSGLDPVFMPTPDKKAARWCG